MLKKFLLIILIPFLFSCIVSDEKLVGGKGNDDGDDDDDPDPVELIYTEPLFLFGQTDDEIKAQEDNSSYNGESVGVWVAYKKYTKQSVTYYVYYYFSDDLMSKVSVLFDFDQAIFDTIYEGLSDKYEQTSDSPITFLNEDNGRRIELTSDVSDNLITIDYL